MKKLGLILLLLTACVGLVAVTQASQGKRGTEKSKMNTTKLNAADHRPFEVVKTDDEWRKQLTEEEFYVARKKGTERAFTGKYWNNHEHGEYHCVCCGNLLFKSDTKFDSGTGWPSFYEPATTHSVRTESDFSFAMERTEVVCDRCGAHLGHVFEDGPKPTGLRYCMNSASLTCVKK